MAGRTPIVDGDGVTFTWRGQASTVAVVGSWCNWRLEDALPLRPTSDGWAGHLPLAPEACVEYRLIGRRSHS